MARKARFGRNYAVIALWIVAAAHPPKTVAQVVPDREGAWFGASLGYGVGSVACNACDRSESTSATYVAIRGGATISQSFLVGVEIGGWRSGPDEDSDAHAAVIATWFPIAQSQVFLRVGVGFERFYGQRFGDGPTEEGSGIAGVAGVGIDLPFTPRASFSPTLTYHYGRPGATQISTTPLRDGVQTGFIGIGLGISLH